MIRAEIGGAKIDRFLSYTIESTLDKGADTFSLEAGFGARGENAGVIIPGQDVKIYGMNGKQLLKGVVDSVDEEDTIAIEGRDMMAEAIDSYPIPKRWLKRKPLQILAELAAALPFTSVDVGGVTEKQTRLKAFQAEAGDSYCDIFQELAEEGNFELYCDNMGNLIARNFPDTPPSQLFNFISVQGYANCKPELHLSVDDVYSTIWNYRGKKKSADKKSDATIAKYVTRTLTNRDGDSTTVAQSKLLIKQMFAEMKNRMRRWTITYGAAHEKFGTVPKLGDGAVVTSFRHGITNEIATVWSVKLELDSKGHTTEVTLRSMAL